MAQTMPLGISDFKEVREKGSFYVDKTRLISDLISDHSKVILLPRPRRFGKTLNLTMLREFFDDQADNRYLFEGLAVCEDGRAMDQLGAFPVIYVTFKDLKPLDWDTCQRKLVLLVGEIFKDQRQRLLAAQLYEDERDLVNTFIADKADLALCQNALALLSKLLQRITGKRVVLLIDEYDSPIHAGYQHGFRQQVVGFMRDFLSGGLKDNSALEKGVLTGILRVAKDSIFSGLNNPSVYTILDRPFSAHFGFSEEEVQGMLAGAGMIEREQEVQRWYNGYRFGTRTIYNPWSILSIFRDPEAPFSAHWINTADNSMIRDLVVAEQAITLKELTALLAGESVLRAIDPFVALNDLKPASVWGLMLLSGYLTLAEAQPDLPDRYALRIPNLEVRSFFASTVNHWLGQQTHVDAMLDSLLREDLPRFEALLTETVVQVLSFHDMGGRDSERVYHVFLAGLLVHLRSHTVMSNRESGYGRYDLVLLPKHAGQLGFVFEFKRGALDELAELAQTALAQIDKHDYEAVFREHGVTRFHKIGLAFCGKHLVLASAIGGLDQEHALSIAAPEPSLSLSEKFVLATLNQPFWKPLLPRLGKKQERAEGSLLPATVTKQLIGDDLSSVIPHVAGFLSEISEAPQGAINRAWQEGLKIVEWLLLAQVNEAGAAHLAFSGTHIHLPVSTHLGAEVLLAWHQGRQPQFEIWDGRLRSPYEVHLLWEAGRNPMDFLAIVAQGICHMLRHKEPRVIDQDVLRSVNSILKARRQLMKGLYIVADVHDSHIRMETTLRELHKYLPDLTVVILEPSTNKSPLFRLDEHELMGLMLFWFDEMKQRTLESPDKDVPQLSPVVQRGKRLE